MVHGPMVPFSPVPRSTVPGSTVGWAGMSEITGKMYPRSRSVCRNVEDMPAWAPTTCRPSTRQHVTVDGFEPGRVASSLGQCGQRWGNSGLATQTPSTSARLPMSGASSFASE